ncbi:hypothetical protein [Pseudarthrobacter oxydans]|uniref:hypothetical protein n=1 Tax=Pseudarthrobacter oxydans TaxID=1671 RepID=UPI00344FA08D
MTAHGHSTGGYGSGRPELPDVDLRLQDLVLDSRDIAEFLNDLAVVAASRLSTLAPIFHEGR